MSRPPCRMRDPWAGSRPAATRRSPGSPRPAPAESGPAVQIPTIYISQEKVVHGRTKQKDNVVTSVSGSESVYFWASWIRIR